VKTLRNNYCENKIEPGKYSERRKEVGMRTFVSGRLRLPFFVCFDFELDFDPLEIGFFFGLCAFRP
jgi:hypothetical protein